MEKYIVGLIQAEPNGWDECLYVVDGKYLHVQYSDMGVDYTFYDIKSLRNIDGGQFDIDIEMLAEAAIEICKFHDNEDISKLCVADIEILDRIQEVQDATALNMRMRYSIDK